MANREQIIEAIKTSGKVRTAQWSEPNEWDQCSCSRCGYDNGCDIDRFCAKCGSYMTNYQPEIRNHYFCKWCGASLDDVSSYTVVEATTVDNEGKDPEPTFTFECPECGRKSMHTFADAEVEILPDSFDAEFAAELGIAIPTDGQTEAEA